MQIKSKYKIARRLGANIFDKTSTQKFALREGRRKEKRERGRGQSAFGRELLEKQKARYYYGVGERQFSKYAREAIAKKSVRSDESLYERLETRLDNAAYRLRLAPTRQAARQLVSHGHITVNGVRITIPSYNVKIGDAVKIRDASAKKALFNDLADRVKDYVPPSWLPFDYEKREGAVAGRPKLVKSELPFDIDAILEFYRR
ncbi:30S ribosomal protein S4 [Patescibacteria group bacterium]|nr:30S ribosomal protein S4 [Patescibacteria group bacterium]